MQEASERIIVAVDADSVGEAAGIMGELSECVGGFKIGLEFIYTMLLSTVYEPVWNTAVHNLALLRDLMKLIRGQEFEDSKLHDIPNTVRGASAVISRMGVKMFNVHCSAGPDAMREAAAVKGNSLLLAVTLLTSLKQDHLRDLGYPENVTVRNILGYMASMAAREGADGLICSAADLSWLDEIPGVHRMLKVTPGIRPKWAAPDDQARITTPAQAIRNGADYLVIGRPITQPPVQIGSRVRAAQLIAEEIESAL